MGAFRAFALGGVAALALAGCSGSDGGSTGTIAGSFEIRAVTQMTVVGELPAGAECAQGLLPLNTSGWICDDETSTAYLVGPAALAAGDVAKVRADHLKHSGGHWAVYLTFTEVGTTKFAALTQDVSQAQPPANQLMMVVDGKVVSAPSVQTPVEGGVVVLSGDYSKDEAKALAAAIRGDVGKPSA